jgi:hypothetical protein
MNLDRFIKPPPAWLRFAASPVGSLWLSCMMLAHSLAWRDGNVWAAAIAILSPTLTVLVAEGWLWWERRKMMEKEMRSEP